MKLYEPVLLAILIYVFICHMCKKRLKDYLLIKQLIKLIIKLIKQLIKLTV